MDVFSNRYEAHNLKLNRGFAAPNHFDAPNMSYHLSSKCQLFKSWIVLSTGQITIHIHIHIYSVDSNSNVTTF